MINHRQWLLLFMVFIGVSTLCLVAEGAFVGTGETSHLNEIISGGWGNPGAIFNTVVTCITWNYAFFETGIGVWVKIPLVCLSAAVIIPLGFELFRLLFKPFGG